jgi:hypothetical protein
MEIKQHKNPSIDIKSSTNIKLIVFILTVIVYGYALKLIMFKYIYDVLICLVVHLILTFPCKYRKLIIKRKPSLGRNNQFMLCTSSSYCYIIYWDFQLNAGFKGAGFNNCCNNLCSI